MINNNAPSTIKEKELVNNLKKITDILKEMYAEDNKYLKIVNAAIYSKTYTDESVLLKDLLFTTNKNILLSNERFKKLITRLNINSQDFKNRFWEIVNDQKDKDFIAFLYSLNGDFSSLKMSTQGVNAPTTNADGSDAPQVSIYFPYSEQFMPVEGGDPNYYAPITTLVTATQDADEGWGYMPHFFNGLFQEYVQVLVNDDFAYNNPTQIIGVNGIEPYDNTKPATYSAFDPSAPIDLPDLNREVRQVYIGDIKIHGHQYDKLISFSGNGGGSEIRFTRSDGFLTIVDGQVQLANVYFTQAKEVGRRDIKKHNWVDVSYEWDGDWEKDNLQQNLAIYEEDNRNSHTFMGSLVTTVTAALTPITVTATRTLGFNINYYSDDELIRQINYNRDVFFILNRINLEGEMYKGWPVRDKNGPLSYTLNDRTFY